jgi:hypothetical protein
MQGPRSPRRVPGSANSHKTAADPAKTPGDRGPWPAMAGTVGSQKADLVKRADWTFRCLHTR